MLLPNTNLWFKLSVRIQLRRLPYHEGQGMSGLNRQANSPVQTSSICRQTRDGDTDVVVNTEDFLLVLSQF